MSAQQKQGARSVRKGLGERKEGQGVPCVYRVCAGASVRAHGVAYQAPTGGSETTPLTTRSLWSVTTRTAGQGFRARGLPYVLSQRVELVDLRHQDTYSTYLEGGSDT